MADPSTKRKRTCLSDIAPDTIATCVLDTFKRQCQPEVYFGPALGASAVIAAVPSADKSKATPPGGKTASWTIVAGIVEIRSEFPSAYSERPDETHSQHRILRADHGDRDLVDVRCVALGAGTKCSHEQSPHAKHPTQVRDAHAEVLCRRAYKRYLYEQMRRAVAGAASYAGDPSMDSTGGPPGGLKKPHQRSPPSIFQLVPGSKKTDGDGPRFQLKSGIQYAMYVSEAPCGDATVEALEAEQPASVRALN
ncbi:hypothetical protein CAUPRSCDRAFT_12657, partial [Caulochytrium protostelioides]